MSLLYQSDADDGVEPPGREAGVVRQRIAGCPEASGPLSSEDHRPRRTLDRQGCGSRPAPTARRVVASGELRLGRADLPARQPAPAPTAGGTRHQAPAARALGHYARAQPGLDPP